MLSNRVGAKHAAAPLSKARADQLKISWRQTAPSLQRVHQGRRRCTRLEPLARAEPGRQRGRAVPVNRSAAMMENLVTGRGLSDMDSSSACRP